MKALLLALAFGLAAPFPYHPTTPPPALVARPTTTVYVCMSKTSYAYHSSDACSGLNRCSHPIKAMTVEAAGELGKRPCHKCY